MKPGSQVRYKVKHRHRRGTVKTVSPCGRYARVLKRTKEYLMVVASLEEMTNEHTNDTDG